MHFHIWFIVLQNMYNTRQLCLRPWVHFELQLLQVFKTCHVSHLSPPLPQFECVTIQVTPPTAPAQGLLGRCLLQPHQLHHGHLQAVAQPIPGTWSVVMAEAIRRTTGLLWLVGHNVSCAVIGWSHGQPRAPLGLGQPSWSQGKKKKRLKQKAEAKQNICFFPSKVVTEAISYCLSKTPMPCHWNIVFYFDKVGVYFSYQRWASAYAMLQRRTAPNWGMCVPKKQALTPFCSGKWYLG